MFAIFIPVYVTAAIAFRLVLAGETKGFIRSAATLQWGLFLTVYNLSHLAFLMVLDVAAPLPAGGAGLLLFVLIVVEFNDVAQFTFGRLFGRHAIAPAVSPRKTWEGFLGGIAMSAAVGVLLAPWLTPFGLVEGALVAAGLAGLGFVGDVTVSAVKRDLGIKDSGRCFPVTAAFSTGSTAWSSPRRSSSTMSATSTEPDDGDASAARCDPVLRPHRAGRFFSSSPAFGWSIASASRRAVPR